MVLDPAPYAARKSEREHERRRAEPYEIPNTCLAEPGFDAEEDDRAEDGPFERAEPTDQRHENHVCRPERAEVGLWLECQGRRNPERARKSRTKCSEQE